MKNFLITAALLSNSGCGVFMTVSEHDQITEKRESEWMTAWKKLEKNNNQLELRILSYKESSKESLKQYKQKREFALSLQKRNTRLLEEIKLLRSKNALEKNRLNNEISLSLEKVKELNQLNAALKKDLLKKENEYENLENSKRRFRCQSWDCFKAAINGSDNFWDKYASQAEEFLGKAPHRRLLEKERKSVIRNWLKGYKKWSGVSRTYFDWVDGDRRKTFVIELGSTYDNHWSANKDFKMSGKIRIEVKSRKDQAFFDAVHKGAWKIIAHVKIKKKLKKDCFWRKCTAKWIIVKVIKKIEFLPDTESFEWTGKPRKKVFSSKKFVYIQ